MFVKHDFETLGPRIESGPEVGVVVTQTAVQHVDRPTGADYLVEDAAAVYVG